MLRLQIEWGADEALEDAPVDRLRARTGRAGRRGRAWTVERTSPPLEGGGWGEGSRTEPPDARTPPPNPLPQGEGEFLSRHLPRLPPLIASPARHSGRTCRLRRRAGAQHRRPARALAAFDGCALRDTAANLVFAAGDPDADLMLIGEPPGEAEDRSGTPFAGPDGVLLDRMLASVGLARDGLLLTPLIPWRPPGGRLPNPAEIARLPAVPAPADRAGRAAPRGAGRSARCPHAAWPHAPPPRAGLDRTAGAGAARADSRPGHARPGNGRQDPGFTAGCLGRPAAAAADAGRRSRQNVTQPPGLTR